MKHILIVDDSKTNLIMARQELKEEYEVTPVISGEQALQFLQKRIPDLILLDINMPVMDGKETLSKIKSNPSWKDIPVIFLTSDESAETEAECLRLGAEDYIRKPFVSKVMRSRIERVINTRTTTNDYLDMARRDPLTGLYNRKYTEELIRKAIESDTSGMMFMIDLDNFKVINDNSGHVEGDRVIRMFADILRQHARNNDIVCRLGGDEFILYLLGVNDRKIAADRAKSILSALTERLMDMGYSTLVSVSIGIAIFPQDGRDFPTLYQNADKALYLVKINGKNSFRFFSDEEDGDEQLPSSLANICFLMEGRQDYSSGAFNVAYDEFRYIFNFISRYSARNRKPVQIILFTLQCEPGESKEKIVRSMDALESAATVSLR
ncbi:MAG: diguanylate cyclase, partial [Lachnospiraceae bacterium]|nr:diguanylate cyclase [Lachnospiraceae bacterium]